MIHHYGKKNILVMSFLNEKGYNFKMSNYGVCFLFFFLMCTVNHVLKTSRLPLLCTVEHLDVFRCILILRNFLRAIV